MKQLLLILMILLVSCGKNPQSNQETEISPLSVKTLPGLMKTLIDGVTVNEETSVINLGDLRSTNSYHFVLSNNTTKIIENITITTDNEAFLVTPDSIINLEVSDGSSSIVPIMKVTVIHGLSDNRLGSAPLLNDTVATLSIKYTYDGKLYETTYELIVNPLSMIIEGDSIVSADPECSITLGVYGETFEHGSVLYKETRDINDPKISKPFTETFDDIDMNNEWNSVYTDVVEQTSWPTYNGLSWAHKLYEITELNKRVSTISTTCVTLQDSRLLIGRF